MTKGLIMRKISRQVNTMLTPDLVHKGCTGCCQLITSLDIRGEKLFNLIHNPNSPPQESDKSKRHSEGKARRIQLIEKEQRAGLFGGKHVVKSTRFKESYVCSTQDDRGNIYPKGGVNGKH